MVGRLQGSLHVKPAPAPGMPPSISITFGLRDEEIRTEIVAAALDAIHVQMQAEGRRLALAIDEFQRLHEWGAEDAEWALKAAMESHPAISYVLAGSKRHVIEAMITTKGRALWKQVDAIEFGPIDPDDLAPWIQSQAARTGVSISLDAADEIVHLAGPRTRDIVQLAREVWFEGRTHPRVEPEHVVQAMDQWVRVQSALYAAVSEDTDGDRAEDSPHVGHRAVARAHQRRSARPLSTRAQEHRPAQRRSPRRRRTPDYSPHRRLRLRRSLLPPLD